eukprot:CAMPEP_0172414782 /NCGR_PEP_ID=MMETSP1064-20121228/1402_1 /TAXON_ID=202472 /ORGANISM="Aulacoseira subarctica , Strain CCAP 1002/5" /LENGTH=638 /DNA_ID=CAMNT_0013151603 /DNA_START=225 /DNA_END=2144 /DNA_ORIENTATION=-
MDKLNGDGIGVSLFHALWSKTGTDAKPSLFRIPDTVIFQLGQPSHWYFTGIDGIILRKRKQNLTVERIEKELAKQECPAESNVIAYFIETTTNEKVRLSSIEYFDSKSLHDFLCANRKERSGILQRFIEPKGSKNSMMCAIWTPQMFLLERRVNKHKLHDDRFGLFERAVTFDGPEIYSASTPVRGRVLSRKIQGICEGIVNHVAQVSEHESRITRLVVNFKLDTSDRVCVLWSSSIRLDSSIETAFPLKNDPVNLESVVRIPAGTKMALTPNRQMLPESTSKQVEKTVFSPCLSCAKTMDTASSHCVTYKTIILHFEKLMSLSRADSENCGRQQAPWPPHADLIEAAGNIGFATVLLSNGEKTSRATEEDICIPPIIRALHPRLKVKGYQSYRKDLLFLHKSCRLCEDCFLSYAKLACNSFHITPPVRVTDEYKIDYRKDQTAYKWLPVDFSSNSQKSKGDNASVSKDCLISSRFIEKEELKEKFSSIDKIFPKAPRMPRVINDSIDEDIRGHRLLASVKERNISLTQQGDESLPRGISSMENVISRNERTFLNNFPNTASLPSRNPLAHLVQARVSLETPADLNVSKNGKKLLHLNPYRQEMRLLVPAIVPNKKVKKKFKKHLPFAMKTDFDEKGA